MTNMNDFNQDNETPICKVYAVTFVVPYESRNISIVFTTRDRANEYARRMADAEGFDENTDKFGNLYWTRGKHATFDCFETCNEFAYVDELSVYA